MSQFKRPMKAPTNPITDSELEQLNYPVLGSPKLDGFRCLVLDQPYTSSMKPFGNRFVQRELSKPMYRGLDGELIVGPANSPDAFHNTSGPLRRADGEPDFKFYAFDRVVHPDRTYLNRWLYSDLLDSERLIILEQRPLFSPLEVQGFEQEMLAHGYEGAMIRSPNGIYKQGRCTLKEKDMFKRKPFVETEARILAFEEAMTNDNEPVENELGLIKRSHSRENMFPAGTLGKFVLLSAPWPLPFRAAPGKGFTAEIRQTLWDKRHFYTDQIATVKYQKHGSREAPRLPSVIKIRPIWDIGG